MAQVSAYQLEVHVEDWFHALYLPEEWERCAPRLQETMPFLLKLFDRHRVRATFYLLGTVALRFPEYLHDIVSKGHRIGSHGFFHRHGEREGDRSDQLTRQVLPQCVGYRSPFWDTTPRPGWAGGAYFRVLPYALVHREVIRRQRLWIHPHDVDSEHPSSGRVPVRRLIGVGKSRERLDQLLSELPFEHFDV